MWVLTHGQLLSKITPSGVRSAGNREIPRSLDPTALAWSRPGRRIHEFHSIVTLSSPRQHPPTRRTYSPREATPGAPNGSAGWESALQFDVDVTTVFPFRTFEEPSACAMPT